MSNNIQMKQVITVLTGVFLATSVFAQTRVVYGKLTAFNTYPVQNVEVTAKKAKTAITSDSLGQFSIVCFENDIIKIKPKTFRPVNKRVGPDTDSLFINLLFIDTKSNRELAVGYGYINEEDLIYAVNHLEQENNDFCNYANIFDLIRGRFSGVMVRGVNVYIRGSGSFSGQTQALYIVNGVSTTSIDWISPCQIKSIDILKDSNAAIYGTRGGNGVVLIETRR
ncbi:MAG: TonB-dependent receptor plug domain-containing protein [Bacteroidales bacterium]|nr:TonB-dependent receptor plug domain-containing protein [Bacteroidales bacterium]